MLENIKRLLVRWGLRTCTHERRHREECGNGWILECDICGDRLAWHLHQWGSNGDEPPVHFIESSGGGGSCHICKKGEDLPGAVTKADYYNILNLNRPPQQPNNLIDRIRQGGK